MELYAYSQIRLSGKLLNFFFDIGASYAFSFVSRAIESSVMTHSLPLPW